MLKSQNERNMPRKRYTPGLGRDRISPGDTSRMMYTQMCTKRKAGCTGEAIIARPKPDTPHLYDNLCPSCAGLTGGK